MGTGTRRSPTEESTTPSRARCIRCHSVQKGAARKERHSVPTLNEDVPPVEVGPAFNVDLDKMVLSLRNFNCFQEVAKESPTRADHNGRIRQLTNYRLQFLLGSGLLSQPPAQGSLQAFQLPPGKSHLQFIFWESSSIPEKVSVVDGPTTFSGDTGKPRFSHSLMVTLNNRSQVLDFGGQKKKSMR
uniref:Uncharacterized protein n=1 Tax=Amphimedon queenslandica TaxID=400682 RepID=A0A1X7T6B4_AMPQE